MKKPARALQRKPPLYYLTYGLAACFAMAGILLCFWGLLQYPGLFWAFLGGALGTALIFVFALLRRKRGLFLGIASSVYVAGVLVFLPAFSQGAALAGRTMASHFSGVFPAQGFVEMPQFSSVTATACHTFLFFTSVLAGAYICWAIVVRLSLLLCLLGTLPFFFFTFNLYGIPHVLGTVLLFSAWFATGAKGQAKQTKPRSSAKVSLAAFALAAVVLAGIVLAVPPQSYSAWRPAFTAREAITNLGRTIQYYSPFGSVPGTYAGAPLAGRQGNVDLASVGNLRFGNGTALRVRGNLYGITYLRGFSASVYEDNEWGQLPPNVYNSASFAFQPLSFTGAYAENTGDISQMEIENIAGNTGYCFTPYLLQNVTGKGGAYPYVQDAYVQPPGNQSNYIASFTLADYPYQNYLQEINQSMWNWVDPDDYAYVTTPEGYTGIMPLTQEDEKYLPYEFTRTLPYEMSDAAYNEKDKDYLAFIQEQYLQLPAGLKETLLDLAANASMEQLLGIGGSIDYYLGSSGYNYSYYVSNIPENTPIKPAVAYWDWTRVCTQVAAYIKGAAQYTLTPGRQPAGQDFATYFLTQSKQGYCMHFATAAALMLRALGVPARYVEGYIISSNSSNNDTWQPVPEKNAHAWVEVWIPSAGWLPLEVTPGGADAEQPSQPQNPSQSGASGNSGAASAAPVTGTSSSQSTASASSSSRGQGAATGSGPILAQFALFWGAVGVVLVVAGYLFLINRNRKMRLQHFKEDDRNSAAIAIYAYLAKLRKFGYLPSKTAQDVANKAKFSQHTLSEQEYDAILQEGLAARGKITSALPWYKRLLLFLMGL